MTTMKWLGIHLISATVAVGSVIHAVSAQHLPSTTAPELSSFQSAEQDMLARARAEREQQRHVSPEPPDVGDTVRDRAIQAEVDRRVREAEREAELDAVTAAIRRSSAYRPTSPHDGQPVDAPELPTAREEAFSAPTTMITAPARATVLLKMAPGRTGIRALAPTADPILCMPDVCWISRGPDRDARMVPRRKALGPLNTLGNRAGACNDSVHCVFRNVELAAASTIVQPVDLRILKHDWRAALAARIDETCRIEHRTLTCAEWQSGGDYRLWVVPEAIAQAAGGAGLRSALGRNRSAAQSPHF